MPADRDGPRGRRPSNSDLHFKKMRRRVQRPPLPDFYYVIDFYYCPADHNR